MDGTPVDDWITAPPQASREADDWVTAPTQTSHGADDWIAAPPVAQPRSARGWREGPPPPDLPEYAGDKLNPAAIRRDADSMSDADVAKALRPQSATITAPEPPVATGDQRSALELANEGGVPDVSPAPNTTRSRPVYQGPPDLTNTYNTILSAPDETRFQAWAEANGKQNDLFDYDLRGAWKADAQAADNGHLPDTWKKPNHPTFSDQSQYNGVDGTAGGQWGQDATGAWTFQPGQTNMAVHGLQGLRDYFARVEPDSKLLPPAAPSAEPGLTEYGPSATTAGVDRPELPIEATARRIAIAARDAWNGTAPILTPKGEQLLKSHGIPDAAISAINAPSFAIGLYNAVMSGGMAGLNSLMAPIIGEQAARDLSAMPEAFPLAGHELGGLGARGPRLTAAESAAMAEARGLNNAPLTVGPETGLQPGEQTPGQAEHQNFANMRARMDELWPAEGQQAPLQIAGPQGEVPAPEAAAQTLSPKPPEPTAAAEPTAVDQAASQANPEPTPAQIEAGNYAKGHVTIGALPIAIETPKGGMRRGVGPDGTPWEVQMPAHYGYVKRTTGADGDHLDISLGPQADQAPQHPVFVVDQIDPQTGKFDEHKGFLGFPTGQDAVAAYDASFSDGSGPQRRGAVTEMPFDQFKTWATSGDLTKPMAGEAAEGPSDWITTPATPSNAAPYASTPKEPQRLIPFLQQGIKINAGTPSERTGQFGLKDRGGDLLAIMGGHRSRPGLINNTNGENLDDAGLRAYQAGYFDHRPDINELLNAVAEDHRGNPQYSAHDQDAVEAYQYAAAHNSEIDNLASKYGLPTRGLTREQFFDRITDYLSLEDAAREHDSMVADHQSAYDQALASARAEGVDPQAYTPRTLQEMEDEHRQADLAQAAGPGGANDQRRQAVSGDAGTGEGGAGQGGRGAGVAGRVGAEGGLDQAAAYREELPGEGLFAGRRLPTPQPAGPDLFGATRASPAQRTPEPTIRTDQRQAVMPGMEPSAVQAQAARDAQGPKGGQQPANEGLFAPAVTPQPELASRLSRWPTTGDNFQDRLAEIQHAGHQAAADWVFDKGRETGHEHVAVVDNRTGEIVHAGTNALENEVRFRGDNGATDLPADSLTIHHNHPNGSALSGPDFGMLANPAVSHVVAHGHDGTTTTASLAPQFAAQRDAKAIGANGLALRNAARQALPVSEKILVPLVHAGKITTEVANHLYQDLANRIIAAQGMIHYTSTVELPSVVRAALGKTLEKLGHGPDVIDRSALAVRPEDRIAGLPAPEPGAQGAGGAGSGATGQGVSGALPEGRLVEGEGLNAGEDLTPEQRGALRHIGRNGPLPPREMPDLINQGPPKPPRERTVAPPESTPQGNIPLREPPQPDRETARMGDNGGPPMPPDGLWPPDQKPPPQPPRSPEVEAARITRPQAVKNLNPVERLAIFPRTLASLDEPSARLWNTWQARERESTVNAGQLRNVITPNFLKLGKPERLRVAGAMEIGRVEGAENLLTNPDGTMTYRNTSTPFARWSKVGDAVTLTPKETAAYREAVQLGHDQWAMLMKAAARRYGWGGDIDPAAIRAAAEQHGEPGGYKRLNRLADLLDVMKQHENDIYFPMQRFGSYFIAIRPKQGDAVTANLGGHPPLAWFETVEKPAFQDLLGVTKGRLSVQAVAAKRIAELQKQFPADKFDIQQGDFARTPSLLRKIDISAVEKLFMLMENKVKAGIQDQVMRGDNPPTTKQGVREEAKNRYDQLNGSTLEVFYDALFEELKSGYRRKAKVVPGYSSDFDRSISSHLFQIARNSADMVHRDSIQSAYDNIQDFHPHDTVKKYWASWRAYQEDPGSTLSRAADTMSQIGFTYVLGMNPSSTIIMASHTPMAAAPVLSVGVGPRVAIPAVARGLGKAYAALRFDTVHGGHIDLDKAMVGMPPEKQAFLRMMANEGRLAAVGTHDMAALNDRLAGLFGDKADIARRGMEIATSNVHAVDQANRFAVASAAWDIASNPVTFNKAATPLMNHSAVFRDAVQREGLSPQTYGRFMLSEAAFEWGKQNQPPIQRGPLGRLMFTLHGFQTRYLSTALNLMKNRGPEGKFAALLMLGALALGAGMQGLPFVEDTENGADALWHHFTGRDPDLKHKLHDAIQDAGFGKIGADMVTHGPLSVALGVNLGSRIGFGDVLSREFESSNVLGTIPSIMWSGYNGASQRAASGQNLAAVASEAAPFAVRGPLRAYSASQQGIVSRKGVPQIPPDQLNGADIARLGAGFTPLSVAERQDETSRYIKAQNSQEAWTDMMKSGDIDGAAKEMAAAGWSAGRIKMFARQALTPPAVSKQFQRFEQQRGVAPTP